MTNSDLQQLDTLIKKNLEGVATKKDLTLLEGRIRNEMTTKKDVAKLRKELRNDIDDAVAQITGAITPLEERVEEIEGRLGIV